MAKKITGTNKETILSHCRYIERTSSKNIQFVCSSAEGGKAVRDAVKNVFPNGDPTKLNTQGASWLGAFLTAGILNAVDNWRVFRMCFSSEDEADECEAAVREALGESNVDTYSPGSGNTGSSGNDGKGGNGEAANYTTYIIIGAAVLLIVILLMKRKKK